MQFAQSKLIPSKNFSESFNIMASEPEKTSESESEIVNLEVSIFHERRCIKGVRVCLKKNYNEITNRQIDNELFSRQ